MFFCKDVKGKVERKNQFYQELSDEIGLRYCNDLASIEVELMKIAPSDNVFLNFPYLSGLDNAMPKDMGQSFVLIYQQNEIIGIAYFQHKAFELLDAYHLDKPASWQKQLMKRISFPTLIAGNLMLTGDYSFYIVPNTLNEQKSAEILGKCIDFAQKCGSESGNHTTLIFGKDFDLPNAARTKMFEENCYSTFTSEPNMVLQLLPSWKNQEDYLDAMHTKYRTKAKRAFKKLEKVQKRTLMLQEIVENTEIIHQLYENISKNALFNLVKLSPEYWAAMKQAMGDDFQIHAYFLNNEIIAFYSYFKNGKELVTHYIGYNPDLNHDLQVYPNILYDYVAKALEMSAQKVVYCRTALEIKSTVGAAPQLQQLILRHPNPVLNQSIKTVVYLLYADPVWEQRHPFK